MGYEVTYHYRTQTEDGEWSEETKQKTAKIGSPYDEVPIDALAGKIIAQLARRNILLEDVEIFEFTKKQLKFRQDDEGIFIGRRKFTYDDGPALGDQGVVESRGDEASSIAEPTNGTPQAQGGNTAEQLLAALLNNPQLLQALQNGGGMPQPGVNGQHQVSGGVNSAVRQRPPREKPIRYEIYNPTIPGMDAEAKKRGFAFTLGQKYPIFSEAPASTSNVLAGMNYTTIDDNGVKRAINDKHFTPDVGPLQNGFEPEPFAPAQRPSADKRLDWGSGVVEDQMPQLR